MRPESFHFIDLTLPPGFFRYQNKNNETPGAKSDKILENRVALHPPPSIFSHLFTFFSPSGAPFVRRGQQRETFISYASDRRDPPPLPPAVDPDSASSTISSVDSHDGGDGYQSDTNLDRFVKNKTRRARQMDCKLMHCIALHCILFCQIAKVCETFRLDRKIFERSRCILLCRVFVTPRSEIEIAISGLRVLHYYGYLICKRQSHLLSGV